MRVKKASLRGSDMKTISLPSVNAADAFPGVVHVHPGGIDRPCLEAIDLAPEQVREPRGVRLQIGRAVTISNPFVRLESLLMATKSDPIRR